MRDARATRNRSFATLRGELASAPEHGVEIVTCDAHFEGLPGVVFIAKIFA